MLCTSIFLRYKKQSTTEICQPHTTLLLLTCGHLGSNVPELPLKKQICSATPPFEENQMFFPVTVFNHRLSFHQQPVHFVPSTQTHSPVPRALERAGKLDQMIQSGPFQPDPFWDSVPPPRAESRAASELLLLIQPTGQLLTQCHSPKPLHTAYPRAEKILKLGIFFPELPIQQSPFCHAQQHWDRFLSWSHWEISVLP